jgi:hypothetical protein
MSSSASCNHHVTTSSDGLVKSGGNVNAGIDSAFQGDPTHRGSLTPPELDSIHQTNSFKQALILEKEDNHELAVKTQQLQKTKEQTKQ